MKRIIIIGLLLLLAGVAVAWALASVQSPQVSAELFALQDASSIAGFARADHIRSFTFPDDHGPHPDFQTEWWYYTGNLDTNDGRHFGYQLTIFRRAIIPMVATRASDWATNQIYFAHFALTDIQANDHFFVERFERGAAGLAGASGNPYHVWLDDWHIESLNADGSKVQMHADDPEHALDLVLTSQKAPVLHGDKGLSQKASGVGNASYYYSFTRLASQGTITVSGETFSVSGLSWMDHEFSTTTLGANAVGWDWFSIQLNDNRELMYFQIREQDGSVEPLSGGTLIEADGTTKRIALDQVKLRVLANWKSDKSGATYPSRWSLDIPSERIALMLTPYIADQENRMSFKYWEGAVKIVGASNGANVAGNGYVEMTGYAK